MVAIDRNWTDRSHRNNGKRVRHFYQGIRASPIRGHRVQRKGPKSLGTYKRPLRGFGTGTWNSERSSRVPFPVHSSTWAKDSRQGRSPTPRSWTRNCNHSRIPSLLRISGDLLNSSENTVTCTEQAQDQCAIRLKTNSDCDRQYRLSNAS